MNVRYCCFCYVNGQLNYWIYKTTCTASTVRMHFASLYISKDFEIEESIRTVKEVHCPKSAHVSFFNIILKAVL